MGRFDAMASAKIYSGKPEQAEINLAMIKFPVLASVKWDGWRMFEFNGGVLCRSLKPPKNRPTQRYMAELFAAAADIGVKGLDGEALVGDPWHPNAMQHSSSMFNSYDNDEPFVYKLFDTYQFSTEPFEKRLARTEAAVLALQPEFPWVEFCDHRLITNMNDLMAFLDEVLGKGGEGVMGRSLDGPYKMGRSTMREGWLWALKPYVDDEAIIIGFEEELENQNEATINERGYTSRAGLKENMIPKGRLGKFLCRSDKFKDTFSIGAGVGLTHELRQYVWDHQDLYLGQIVRYKYQDIGIRTRPRQPKFMGIRPARDIALDRLARLRGLVK